MATQLLTKPPIGCRRLTKPLIQLRTKPLMGECFPWTPKPLYDLSTLEPTKPLIQLLTKPLIGECFPWTPKPLYDLSTLEPEILGEMNDTVTCVVLCEGCDDETKAQMSEVLEFIYVHIYIYIHNIYIYI